DRRRPADRGRRHQRGHDLPRRPVPAARAARASGGHVMTGVVSTGAVATVVAATATTVGAALAKAAGVDFEVPDGGEVIPTGGFATITGVFSLVGVGIAVALERWSSRPAKRFVAVTVPLVAVSLVPPFTVGASTATSLTLVVLHLVA